MKQESLKAIEHEKYQNIADSVWLSLFMISNSNVNAYRFYCPGRLAPGRALLNNYNNMYEIC
jgi:hypothetical protein